MDYKWIIFHNFHCYTSVSYYFKENTNFNIQHEGQKRRQQQQQQQHNIRHLVHAFKCQMSKACTNNVLAGLPVITAVCWWKLTAMTRQSKILEAILMGVLFQCHMSGFFLCRCHFLMRHVQLLLSEAIVNCSLVIWQCTGCVLGWHASISSSWYWQLVWPLPKTAEEGFTTGK